MKNFLFLILAFFLISSCGYMGGEHIDGNGNWKTSERTVNSFDAVDVSGAVDVRITQGDIKPVKVEIDENLQDYIEVFVQSGVLVVKTKSGYNIDPSKEMIIYITAPKYKSIEVSGACKLSTQGKINNPEPLDVDITGAGEINMELNAPRTRLGISGAGSAVIVGETKEFELDISGAGKARCFDFKSETTTVDLSGAGDAEVFASVKLDASASGAGTIHYKGNPSSVSDNKSGAASISKAD